MINLKGIMIKRNVSLTQLTNAFALDLIFESETKTNTKFKQKCSHNLIVISKHNKQAFKYY